MIHDIIMLKNLIQNQEGFIVEIFTKIINKIFYIYF